MVRRGTGHLLDQAGRWVAPPLLVDPPTHPPHQRGKIAPGELRAKIPQLQLGAGIQLGREDIAKSAVIEIIGAQKGRFSVRELLQHAYSQEANEKAALFRIIGELADASSIPELTSRLDGKDTAAAGCARGGRGRPWPGPAPRRRMG